MINAQEARKIAYESKYLRLEGAIKEACRKGYNDAFIDNNFSMSEIEHLESLGYEVEKHTYSNGVWEYRISW